MKISRRRFTVASALNPASSSTRSHPAGSDSPWPGALDNHAVVGESRCVSRPQQAGEEWGSLLAELRSEWSLLLDRELDAVSGWESALSVMEAEVDALRSEGRWLSGGRTLLHALGLHHDEVRLCRGLAWLLKPDGWHRLGDRPLRGLLESLGVASDSVERASVVVEESRATTRADIVVRWPGGTLLFEAKVFAGEQPRQCDRLADLWGSESPTLVFVTRDGREPMTAMDSRGEWSCLSWRQIGDLIAEAAEAADDPAPGVQEFVATVSIYGG